MLVCLFHVSQILTTVHLSWTLYSSLNEALGSFFEIHDDCYLGCKITTISYLLNGELVGKKHTASVAGRNFTLFLYVMDTFELSEKRQWPLFIHHKSTNSKTRYIVAKCDKTIVYYKIEYINFIIKWHHYSKFLVRVVFTETEDLFTL